MQPRPLTPISSMKLLVADDCPIIQMVWRDMANYWDLPVELSIAEDGNQALQKVMNDRPDLIITDLDMPHTDGRELIKILGKHPQYADIPIVVVSGSSANDLIMEPAVIAFLAKPFHFEEIRQLLKEQIQKLPDFLAIA